ncbi:uncharacterized protein V2V93DRAFT_363672 [Kockiozyma suomiensis]|uniref:uncharacterized protein n=1 Tax=Kockiozyma suomiensis TaxID=1337062 RepID=UPI0033436841
MAYPVCRLRLTEPFQLSSRAMYKDRPRKLVVTADFSCLVDLPSSVSSVSFSDSWNSFTVLLINETRLKVEVSVDNDIDISSNNFLLALSHCIFESPFWIRVGLRPASVSSPDATKADECHSIITTFENDALDINQHLSTSPVPLPLTHIQSLTVSFTYKWQGVVENSLYNDSDPDILRELLVLTDNAFRVLIMGNLAVSLPVIFCPRYSESIISRFKFLNEAIVPSMCSILKRRSERLGIQISRADPGEVMLSFWRSLTSELKRRLASTLFLDKFFDIEEVLQSQERFGSVFLSSQAEFDVVHSDSTKLSFDEESILLSGDLPDLSLATTYATQSTMEETQLSFVSSSGLNLESD